LDDDNITVAATVAAPTLLTDYEEANAYANFTIALAVKAARVSTNVLAEVSVRAKAAMKVAMDAKLVANILLAKLRSACSAFP